MPGRVHDRGTDPPANDDGREASKDERPELGVESMLPGLGLLNLGFVLGNLFRDLCLGVDRLLVGDGRRARVRVFARNRCRRDGIRNLLHVTLGFNRGRRVGGRFGTRAVGATVEGGAR